MSPRIYVVTMYGCDELPKEVLDRYISRALKNYSKHDPESAFESPMIRPMFRVESVNVSDAKEDALRKVIQAVKQVTEAFDRWEI